MSKSPNKRIFALFAFVILSSGLSWPISKLGLTFMPPLWFSATRLIIGTLTMMALVIILKKFSLPKRKDIPLILIIGLLQISIYMVLANIGLSYLPAGRSSLIGYTTPLWIMPATLFLHEDTGVLRWLGFALGIAGLTILLSPWDMDWSTPHALFGASMLLLASLGWAISILCARYMHWSKSPLELIPWQLLIGAIPILFLAWLQEPILQVQWDPTLILSLIYTGILVTGLTYWSAVIINKELPPMTVSLGFLLVPVCSLIVSANFMQEIITLSTLIAITLILSGIYCVIV